MKRKFIVLAALFMVSAAAFANVEIDVSYMMNPVGKFEVSDKPSNSSFEFPSYVGFSDSFYFFSNKTTSVFEAGFAIQDGFFFCSDGKAKIAGSPSKNISVTGWYLGLGPVFRITPWQKFSFIIVPTLQVSGIISDKISADTVLSPVNVTIADFSFDFDINLGGRFWFLNKTGFHLGLGFGTNVSIPLAGAAAWTSEITIFGETSKSVDAKEILNGIGCKFYIGLCMNIGGRGYDRKYAASE